MYVGIFRRVFMGANHDASHCSEVPGLLLLAAREITCAQRLHVHLAAPTIPEKYSAMNAALQIG